MIFAVLYRSAGGNAYFLIMISAWSPYFEADSSKEKPQVGLKRLWRVAEGKWGWFRSAFCLLIVNGTTQRVPSRNKSPSLLPSNVESGTQSQQKTAAA